MKKLALLATAAALTTTLTACPGVKRPDDTGVKPEQVRVISATAYETKVKEGSDLLAPTLEAAKWSKGAQALTANVLLDSGEIKTLATGQITADGRLSLTLPETVDASYLSANLANMNGENPWMPEDSDITCKTQVNVSDSAARSVAAGFLTADGQTIYPGELSVIEVKADEATQTLTYKSSDVLGSYIYADRAATVKGQQTCSNPTGETTTTTNLNMTLHGGWNYVQLKMQYTLHIKGETFKVTGVASADSAVPAKAWYTDARMAMPLGVQAAGLDKVQRLPQFLR